jgi:uncharacterized protein
MDSKGEHLEYISQHGLYSIDCNREIFTYEEMRIIQKWGHWFTGLVSGELKPFTDLQERFIKVMNGVLDPSSIEEIAWFKYRGRKAVEKKYGDQLKVQYALENDTFKSSGGMGYTPDYYRFDEWYMSS